jgi:hypothetical protein
MLPDFEHFSGEAMSSVASPDSLKALLCGFFGSRILDP